jgi:Flp pilus assembly protein TadG
MLHPHWIRLRRRQTGMVLIAAALTVVILIGMLGLAFDLARMYTARNELQAFVDAASIAAAMELNGTTAGLDHARDKALNYPGRWGFETYRPQNITVSFASEANGTYSETPASATGLMFARVQAEATVRMYFLPGFSTLTAGPPPAAWFLVIGRDQLLRARATSGQFLEDEFRNGLLPYSPDAHNPADKVNFGLTRGQMYTLRWPPLGLRDNKNQWCDGDEAANFVTPADANDRGYIDIAGNGSNDIRQAIINNLQTRPLEIGDVVNDDGGNRGTESDALRERFWQDTDNTSITYSEYLNKINDPSYTGPKGNGRRFVIVPVRNPWNNVVVGFGGFFLHGDICQQGGDNLDGNWNSEGGLQNASVCCAEFVGPAVVGGRRGGGGNSGAYRVKLFQ